MTTFFKDNQRTIIEIAVGIIFIIGLIIALLLMKKFYRKSYNNKLMQMQDENQELKEENEELEKERKVYIKDAVQRLEPKKEKFINEQLKNSYKKLEQDKQDEITQLIVSNNHLEQQIQVLQDQLKQKAEEIVAITIINFKENTKQRQAVQNKQREIDKLLLINQEQKLQIENLKQEYKVSQNITNKDVADLSSIINNLSRESR